MLVSFLGSFQDMMEKAAIVDYRWMWSFFLVIPRKESNPLMCSIYIKPSSLLVLCALPLISCSVQRMECLD